MLAASTLEASLVPLPAFVPVPKLLHSRTCRSFPKSSSTPARGAISAKSSRRASLKLERHGQFTWREIDVDSDAEIRRLYTDEVPVVFINGRKAFKYRMNEQDFLRKLAS